MNDGDLIATLNAAIKGARLTTGAGDQSGLNPVEMLLDNSSTGEVRIQPIRYSIKGCRFIAIVALQEMPDQFWEKWEDMTGGDMDYFDAEMYLASPHHQKEDRFGFGYGATIADAVASAMRAAQEADCSAD